MSEDNLSLSMQYLRDMIAKGWTASAIASQSGINQITVANIKNGKASRVTDKVFTKIAALKKRVDAGQAVIPRRGRRPAAESTGAASTPNRGTPARQQPAAPPNTAAPAKRQAPPDTAAPAKRQAPPDTAAPAKRQAPANTAAPAKRQAPPNTAAQAKRQSPSEPTTQRGTAKPAADSLGIEGMISTDYVPVDIVRLLGMIDRLIANFAGAVDELEQIRARLKR